MIRPLPPTEHLCNTIVPVSVIMITVNEALYLSEVLENIKDWAQDIFIVDSLSTDKTVDIALEYGVNIVQRPFTNFGDQWNFAIGKLPIKTPWTLKLDPDERLSKKLKMQIAEVTSSESPADGYCFPRRLWFMAKPLHVRQNVVRLWKTGKCRFSDTIVNEQPIVAGKIERLTGTLEHLDSPDLHHWGEKQNRYTTMEAVMKYRGDRLAAEPKLLGTALERWMYLKKVFWSIPMRYQFLYLYQLFRQGAWLDGKTGHAWARLRTEVYRICELKFKEIQLTGNVPQVPKATHGDYDTRILASSLQQELMPETFAEVL